MIRQISSIALVIALPFLLEATTGCSLDTAGICSGDCLRDPAESNLNSYVCSCSCSPASRHREVRVTASADDAEESTTIGAIELTSPVLDLGFTRVVGMRFVAVGIPPGADVTGAHLEFTPTDDDNLLLSFEIVGEAAANAATFSSALHDVTNRADTTNSVSWTPGAWSANGSNQNTPDLQLILQEIIDLPGWAENNALVLVISATAGDGSRRAVSQDGQPFQAPLLVIDYEEPSPKVVGPQNLPVCVLPGDNPNIGGSPPSEAELEADCVNRVQATLSGLSAACQYPSDCHCSLQSESQSFADVCDTDCAEDPVDDDCTNFDPIAGMVDATNAPGDQKICHANSPLAFGIYGRRTACSVMGSAHMELAGDSADPSVTGILQFIGDPCVGGGCAVRLEHRLDISPVTFSNIFDSETFEDLAGLGESLAGQDAVLSATGDGTYRSAACIVSARGRRGSEAQALVTANDDDIHVNVSFGSTAPTCSLNGALVGSADPELKRCEEGGDICDSDSDCGDDDSCSEVGDSQLLLSLNVGGPITNQPPTADAGEDQIVECPAPGVLDASASSDLDSNLSLFSWMRGTRNGEMVGFERVSNVEQGLGTQTYVLRVIDALAQTDEDSTEVTVVDTTPPDLSCAVAMPVLPRPNHSMVNVGLAGRAHDACEGELPVMVSTFADENDEEQTGDGNFSPDAADVDLSSLRLRQERKGNGDGRVYLILVEATDSSGNRGINCCTVVVPHSNSQVALQSAQAQAAAAQAFCLANSGVAPAGYFETGDGPTIGPKQ